MNYFDNNTNPNGGTVKIYAAGRLVGQVKRGVLTKQIIGSRHMLRAPRGIALDVDSIRQAKIAGAHTIAITDGESGLIYSSDVSHFMQYAIDINRGFGAQKCLPLQYWTTSAGKRKNLPLPIATPIPAADKQPAQLQLSLF